MKRTPVVVLDMEKDGRSEYNLIARVAFQRQIDPIIEIGPPSRNKSEAMPERKECGDTSATILRAEASSNGNTANKDLRSHSCHASCVGRTPLTGAKMRDSPSRSNLLKCQHKMSAAVTVTAGSPSAPDTT